MGFIVRERLHTIPHILWLNFTAPGWTSTSVHLGLWTWNSKLGLTTDLGHGVSYRASRRRAIHPHRQHTR